MLTKRAKLAVMNGTVQLLEDGARDQTMTVALVNKQFDFSNNQYSQTFIFLFIVSFVSFHLSNKFKYQRHFTKK